MPEQAEAGHVRDRARRKRAQPLGGVAIEDGHPLGRRGDALLVPPPLAGRVQDEAGPERLRQEERVARTRARLRPVAVRMHRPDHREPVLRLVVAERVAAGEDRACLTNLPVGAGEDGRDRLVRQALRQRRDREREQRRAAHRVDVVEGVRRGDAAVEAGIVDERREEVEREDERPLVVEPVHGGVVCRREPHEEVLRVRRDEAAEELLEPGGGVLRRAAAALRELRQSRRHRQDCTRARTVATAA